jgi:hypothetical protein
MALREKALTTDAELFLFAVDSFVAHEKIKVGGRPWRQAEASAKDNRTPDFREDWLLHVLSAMAELLNCAFDGLPLRQFLDIILSHIPSDVTREESITAARLCLRKARWTNLLELDCQTVAGLLYQIVMKLREYWHREREFEKESREAHSTEDLKICGAIAREPSPFVFRRRLYHFPYYQSLLLEALSDGERHSVVEVIEHVWCGLFEKKLERCKNRLYQLQRDTNAALRRREIPLQVVRPAANWLYMLKT